MADSPYRRALHDARNRNVQFNAEAQRKLLAAFKETLSRIPQNVGGTLTAERARALEKQYKALFSSFQSKFNYATQQGIDLTIDDVIANHDKVMERLRKSSGMKVAADFEGVNDAVYRNLAIRRGAPTFQSLLNRRIQGPMLDQIDTFLGSAVQRGISTRQATVDLARLMASDSPTLIRHVNKVPANSTVHSFGGYGKLDYERYGIPAHQVAQVKSIFYDARRIAMSEINNTLREANSEALIASPVVKAAKWQRSGRGTNACECDVLSSMNAYGFGPGFYPVEYWPAAPHPHCGCYQGEVLQRMPSEWGKPRVTPPPIGRDGLSKMDDALKAVGTKAKWTPNRMMRARETTLGIVREAEGAWAKRTGKPGLKPKPKPTPKPKPAPKPVEPKPPAPVPTPKGATAQERLDNFERQGPILAEQLEKQGMPLELRKKALNDEVQAISKQMWDSSKVSYGSAEFKALDAQVRKLAGEMHEITLQVNALKRTRLDALHDILAVPVEQRGVTPMTFEAKKPDARWKAAVDRGREAFEKFVNKNLYSNHPKFTVKKVTGRADYRNHEKKIRVDDRWDVMVHEMCHWLEMNNPQVLRKLVEFRSSRTVGESIRKLNKLRPGYGYGNHEETLADKFDDPYTGKVYRNSYGHDQATEILSMGLQELAKDPWEFRRKDPQFFRFIVELVGG